MLKKYLFRRRDRATRTYPAWYKWGVAGFILIMLTYAYATREQYQLPQTAEKNVEALTQNSQLKTILGQQTQTAPSLKEVEIGAGPALLCGQDVSLQVQTKSKSENITFRIGEGKVDPLLERGISGMKLGGKRALTFSQPITFQGEEIAALVLTVTALKPDVSALLKDGTNTIKLYDDAIGDGVPAVCGDSVTLNATVWGKENAVAQPLTLTIGAGTLPLAIEQGAIGMMPGGKRTIIAPPAWQRPLRTASKGVNGLPSSQPVTLEIERMK